MHVADSISENQQKSGSALRGYNMSEAKTMHLKRAKNCRERKESLTREHRMFDNNRWEDFRQRRLVVMDKYIAAKTLQRRAEEYVKQLMKLHALKNMWTNY